ncbi:MAG: hypothetical protein KatS3mg111_1461 [Pirellulaceae bacterium]|nr:MAG: hypothetical protein KatS3mg111_1461 [Pirellulaceae bacterium]
MLDLALNYAHRITGSPDHRITGSPDSGKSKQECKFGRQGLPWHDRWRTV